MSEPATMDRYIRQRDIVPASRLAGLTVTVAGIGAIGRPVALQLAAMGVERLHLVDFDAVAPENLATQGYLEEDLGRLKVTATASMARRINSGIDIHEEIGRFRRSSAVGHVLFVCVDAIETRRLIWEGAGRRVDLWVDTRMSAEVVRILAAGDAQGRAHYPTTLFAASEAHAGACTSKATIYTAGVAAGLAVGQFTKWLRGIPVEPELGLNLLTAEWTTPASSLAEGVRS
jgi:sulfur carrier protein ThiS adenylyltransferase